MPPHADDPQHETDNCSQDCRQSFGNLHSNRKHHDSRARQGGRRVYIGAKDSRDLGQQNIPYRSASYTRNAAHENRDKRVDAIGQCFARAGNGEKGQARSVQAENEWVRNLLNEMMEKENDRAPEEGDRPQTPVAD